MDAVVCVLFIPRFGFCVLVFMHCISSCRLVRIALVHMRFSFLPVFLCFEFVLYCAALLLFMLHMPISLAFPSFLIWNITWTM